MTPFHWVSLLGSLFGLGFLINGLRLSRGPEGHAANAGRLHVAGASVFLFVIWVILLFSFL